MELATTNVTVESLSWKVICVYAAAPMPTVDALAKTCDSDAVADGPKPRLIGSSQRGGPLEESKACR